MDRVTTFLAERGPRRVVALGVFLGLLYLFRELAILLVFFVAFERGLGAASRGLAARTRASSKTWALILTALLAGGLAGIAWLGVGRTIRAITELQDALPTWIVEIEANPFIASLHEQFGGTERLVEGARHYAGSALSAASAIGHFFVHVLIGYVLALIFVLQEDELRVFYAKVDPRSLAGTLGRWGGHVADATVVTVQLQLIVALFNTVTTLPVLLLLGVPHVASLMILIFVSALVPVIGNVVCGAILSLLAYQEQGWLGVGIFIGLTFILHKIESYYLSPRLTARHVKVPGFLLIVSIIAAEHLFGFMGLFLAFPILFVASRIRTEWGDEDGETRGPASAGVIAPPFEAVAPAIAPPIDAPAVDAPPRDDPPPSVDASIAPPPSVDASIAPQPSADASIAPPST